MDFDQARTFIRENNRGVLSTYRHDGRPQLSPVLATVDSDGRVVISTRETAYKVKNARATPQASYCGFTQRFFGEWVQVDGRVEIISLPDAMEQLINYYRAISGEHPNWEEYQEAMVREQRVIFAITPTYAGPERSG